jgi:hypothetical protein
MTILGIRPEADKKEKEDNCWQDTKLAAVSLDDGV